MASKNPVANIDLNSVFEGAAAQFRGLNPNEPGQWPLLPKLGTWVLLFQMAGLVLLVAMIGAIVLTLRARPGVRRQVIAVQNARTAAMAVELVDLQPGQAAQQERV